MDYKFKFEGEQVEVTVLQTSKTVWEASGDFEGSTVTVKGNNRMHALNRWRSVARRQGD